MFIHYIYIIFTSVYVCMSNCVRVYVCKHVCVQVHVCMCVSKCVYKCVCVCVFTATVNYVKTLEL